MNLAAEIIMVVFTWLTICFLAGFVETWWEQRKREKERDKNDSV